MIDHPRLLTLDRVYSQKCQTMLMVQTLIGRCKMRAAKEMCEKLSTTSQYDDELMEVDLTAHENVTFGPSSRLTARRSAHFWR